MRMDEISDINSLRAWGSGVLSDADITDAAADALLLMEYVLDVDRNHILLHGNEEIDPEKKASYRELIKRRSSHVPLQYITGHQEFMGLDFTVNEHVLIPRLDTECLVEEAMIVTGDGMRVLDLCTGSGCILVSLMKYKNEIEGIGTDISDEALEMARLNAANNGVAAEFVQGDLYEALKADDAKFDVIISNPPYIRKDVIPGLMEEVREHEPVKALDGGEDGLDFYRRIINGADEWLLRGGSILFEIGYDQGEAVKGMLEDKGYRDVRIVKDLAGLDRVVSGCRPHNI